MKWYSLLLVGAGALPAWPQVRFEVTSVRLSPPGVTARDSHINFRGERFEARAATVGDILDMLDGWQLYRITGGPPWMRIDRYDIEAKAERELDDTDRASAVMALLNERFKLESHQEMREVPGVVLLAPRTFNAVKHSAEGERYSIGRSGDDIGFTAVPMSGVTNYLSQFLRAPIVDETDMKGTWDFVVPISHVEPQPGDQLSDRMREAFAAVGFRLQDRKIPLEITVVDRCERPTAN